MTKGSSSHRHSKANRAARARKAEEWKNTRGGDPRTSWLPKDLENGDSVPFTRHRSL